MERRIVLSLCDRTGIMVQPWADAGYECWIVDEQHKPGQHIDGNVVRFGMTVQRFMEKEFGDISDRLRIVTSFPPCTSLANSGNRWKRDKGLRALIDALEVVESCRSMCEGSGAPWMLENPVGALSTYWREPDCTFHPYEFAAYLPDFGSDAYTKKTCLWHGGGFRMPVPKRVPAVDGSKMHLMPPSKDRADLRSVTPRGFAQAVYEANKDAI